MHRFPSQSVCKMSLGLAAIFLVAAAASADSLPQVLRLEEQPVPLAAARARTEAEQDRVEALAHFATGRTYQQRGDFPLALRHYARAVRLDPASTAARSALVASAVERKQFALAARYAVKPFDPQEVGDEGLQSLADYWAKEGDFSKAAEYYEQSLLCIDGDNESEIAREAAFADARFELGRLYGIQGKYANAADQFARVIEGLDHLARLGMKAEAFEKLLGMSPSLAYELFGETFLRSDRLAEAEKSFRKSHALAPNENVLNFNLARIAFRRGQAQEALVKMQGYLDRDLSIEGTAPYQLLADVLKKLGKENETFPRLQKLHDAHPANAPLSYFLAMEYLKAGKLDLAEPLCAELASKGGTLAYPGLAEIYRKDHRFDNLLELLGKAVSEAGTLDVLGAEAKPLSTDAELFRSLVEAGRKKSAVPLKADYAAFLALGMLSQDRKQHETAAEFYELALRADPSKASEIMLSWGIGALMDNRMAEAAKMFQRGIDLQTSPGGIPVFQYYLAGALASEENAGKPDKPEKLDAALAAARSAARGKPDSARFAARVAWILFRARRYVEAREAYEKLLKDFADKADSAETAFALREARLELSSVCVDLGRLDEAEERLEEVLDEYPDDVGARNDLGFLWADRSKHLQRALGMILVAVAAEPENRAYRDSLGWVYYRLGRFGEAVTELEKAVDEKQPDGTVLDHLGDAYVKVRKTDKALAAWRRAKEAFEKDKEAEKARKVDEKMRRG